PVVMAAFRADVQVLLQVGAVQHGIARRALGPQALRHRLLRSGAALDFRRQQLLQPAHASSASRIGFSNALTRATASAGPAASISWMMRLPMTTASALRATARADSASRIPNPTPIGSRVAARIFGRWAATSERSSEPAPVTPLRET